MIKIGEKYTVKIEKLINGGDAISKINKFTVFVEKGCPDDIAEIEILKVNKSFAAAKIVKITEPSKFRITPPCHLHNVCGGCGLQHIEYKEQLRQKENMVRETIYGISGENIEILPLKYPQNTFGYRHKVQYPVSQTKVSKRIIAGYFKKGTHEAVNIKHCPVQPEIVDEITEFIRLKAAELNISGYNEKTHSGLLRHINYRISSFSGEILITFILNCEKIPENIRKLAEVLYNTFKIKGITANFNNKKTNVILGGKNTLIIGEDCVTEEINKIRYKISGTSFFQINPESAGIIFSIAKQMIAENNTNPSILDAYSGVSAFGLQMKDIAKEIISVEENSFATEDAKINIKINNAKNCQVINGNAFEIFDKFVKENKKFDVILLDPPRKGCGEAALSRVVKLCKKDIVYVSCNPATLASDIKYLHQNSFRTKYIQPVDMFCHTPHIECVALIERVEQ